PAPGSLLHALARGERPRPDPPGRLVGLRRPARVPPPRRGRRRLRARVLTLEIPLARAPALSYINGMNKQLLLPLLFVGALSTAAAAEDGDQLLWTDLAGRPLAALQETGGQVTEEWYSPKVRASLSVFGRVSFPGST